MATGTTVNFTITRTELVDAALRMLGNHYPSQTDRSNAVQTLNMRLRVIDTKGRWFWGISNTETTLTLTSGNRSYSVATAPTGIASNILDLELFQLWDGVGYTPVRIVSKEESLNTWEREGTGQPYLVFLERGLTAASNKIHTFPTPDATYTAKYTYRRRLYDFDLTSDNPDLPQDAYDFLKKDLASQLAPEYGKSLPEIQLLSALADKALEDLRAANTQHYDIQPVATEYF